MRGESRQPVAEVEGPRWEWGSIWAFSTRVGRWMWRSLASVRLAVVLILLLANFGLIGTLLIQVSPETAADPAEYAWWLENVIRPKLGFWTTPLDFLGLFDVFHSAWFLGTGALLVVSIVLCNLNRWKQIRSAVAGTRVRLADGFYERGTNRAQFTQPTMPPAELAATTARVFKRRGYRVRMDNASEDMYIAADKNRYFRLGTYLTHLSIILFILGFLLGSYLGFRHRSFMVPEGSTRELGYGTGLSLYLESFVDEYYPEGPPKDYRSQVVLFEDGVEVQRGLIRVNHPMSYKGVRFYQSFFGPAVVMRASTPSGELLYEDGVALGWLSGEKPFQRPTGTFNLPSMGLTAYVLAPAQGVFDPMLEPGEVRLELYRHGTSVPVAYGELEQGVPEILGGVEFTFVRERQFSGFNVSRDPGNRLIWIASGMFVAGLVAVFYFPHRQIWARVRPQPAGGSQLLVRTTARRGFGVASEFESVREELERELASH